MNEEQSVPATSTPKKRKWPIVLVAIVLLVAVGYAVRNKVPGTSEAVAVVNGVEISRDTLTSSLAQAPQEEGVDPAAVEQQVLDSLVVEELLVQEAQAAGITANEEQAQQQFDELAGQFESEEAFQSELAAAQITKEQLREAMARSNMIQTYLDQKIPVESVEVSDEEIQTQLDLVAGQVEGQDEVSLEEIRPLVEQQIQQQKYQQQVAALIETLRAQSEITILL